MFYSETQSLVLGVGILEFRVHFFTNLPRQGEVVEGLLGRHLEPLQSNQALSIKLASNRRLAISIWIDLHFFL